MPVMLRLKGKPTKIAYSILGVPQNMKKTKNKKNDKVNRRLVFEETVRVR